ncbi:MAG: alpha-1,3-galactosidase-related protein [Tepidisphaeraceae bacterium]
MNSIDVIPSEAASRSLAAEVQALSALVDTGRDATLALRRVLHAARTTPGGQTLTLAPSRYDFWADRADEHYLFISNNGDGLRRVAFPLFHLPDGFHLNGNGARFVFHRSIIPFALVETNDISLTNCTVDWQRTFHSEGAVLSVDDRGCVVQFNADHPYRVQHGRLRFKGEATDWLDVHNILEFDAAHRETAYMAKDNYGAEDRLTASDLGDGRVRIDLDFASPPTVGNVLVFSGPRREAPVIFIQDCRGVHLSDITLHHGGGMGVIAQHSRDVTIDRLRVTPAPGRQVSLTADATHFVNCAGHIALNDCIFENQLDDASNVHGIYAQVTGRRADDGAVEVRLVHHEQLGIDIARPGDRIEFVRSDSLERHHAARVMSVRRLNKEYSELLLDDAPADLRAGDAVNSLDWQPDVTIRGCVLRGNRARGLLISTSGSVCIEDNHFHVPGAAILLAGDANFWFESGPVDDVTIRRNTFDECNFGVWGRAAIDIEPVIHTNYRGRAWFHRNISILNNTFRASDGRVISAACVDGLTVEGNDIVWTNGPDYPARHRHAEPIHTEHCRHLRINPLAPAAGPDRPVTTARPVGV